MATARRKIVSERSPDCLGMNGIQMDWSPFCFLPICFESSVFVSVVFVVVVFSGVEETRRKTTLCQKKVKGTNKLNTLFLNLAHFMNAHANSYRSLTLRVRFLTPVNHWWIGNVISSQKISSKEIVWFRFWLFQCIFVTSYSQP